MQAAFATAMDEFDYDGGYTAVYPIKVNQHLSVAGELVARAGQGFGLEAGSKPELVAVLALSRGGIVICNGYKDREYIRLALIGRKLGLDVFIVIEKPSELDTVLEEAAALGVEPLLGARLRLASLGAGKWQNTGGDKAKFGLSPRQLLDLAERLRAVGKLDALRLLHFHMGSQISNLRDIAGGMREATRYMSELVRLGADIRYMDVGVGLGIDYEGGVLDHPARVAVHFTHRLGAVLAALAIVLFGVSVARAEPTRADGLAVLAALIAQLSLGISIVVFGVPLAVAVAHNGMAALLLLAVLNANQRIRQS